MFEASGGADAEDRVDATLATLVPRPSVVRNVVAIAAAVAVLVGVGMAPDYVRPQVTSDGGSIEVLRASGSVLTISNVAVTSRSDVELLAVGRAPGADLLGAWLLPAAEIDRMYAAPPIDDRDPLHTLDIRYQGDAPLDGLRLPQRLAAGRSARLVLLWKITDCSALTPHFPPELDLRSTLGLGTRIVLGDFSGPTFTMAGLVDTGVCDPRITPADPLFPWDDSE